MQMETDCPRRGWEALSIEMASGHGGLAGALGRWEVQNLSEAGRELNLPLEALKGLGHHLQKSLSFFFWLQISLELSSCKSLIYKDGIILTVKNTED